MAEDAVFEEARDAFLTSLQPRERRLFKPCKSAAELLEHVRKLDAFNSKHSLLRKFIVNIEKFGDSLTPFFSVIGLFVQSHPEIASIVWGAVRLIIQVRKIITVLSPPLIALAGEQFQLILSKTNNYAGSFDPDISAV
jgi:hypothetical protein